ncbi:MAG: ABC transporter substrate-binding protein [Candidatus Thiothrix moscowensis]|nr:ABC transporter substrate-binding protein [Candidatus Thiothrix moscowensis]
MSIGRLLAWLFICLQLAACSPDYEGMAQQRMEYARQNKGDIHIVAVQDTYKSNYLNGVLLAAEVINQRPGKLLGRTLNVSIEQDGESFEATKPTIRRIAANPKITAVLGHRSSSVASPASVVYERSQIIFIPPFSTAQELTGHAFQYVFRMTPNAKVMAEQIASVAQYLGYKNIVILYSRDDINREQAFLFEDAAVKQGVKLVQNSSFFEGEENYRPLISQFTGKDFDAIFIAAPTQAGGKMVRQLREMGVNKPVLGGDGFNLPAYAKAAGDAAQNTIIPTIYRPNPKNPRNTTFIQRYQEKYHEAPDYNAAQGYDSVMLLAAAIEKAGSTVPALLSSTIHYLPAWLGATGLHAYDEMGDLYGKHYVFNVWQRGEFRPLPAIHIPYLLERFEKHLQAAATTTTQATDSPKTTDPIKETATASALTDKQTVPPAQSPVSPTQASPSSTQQPDTPAKPSAASVSAIATSQTQTDKATSLASLFSSPMHVDDHKVRLLELAQSIFRFQRIGLIYEDTDSGRQAAGYTIVKQMTEQRGVKLVGCDIPFSALTPDEIELELISCYGKLSLNADAVFIVNYTGINPSLMGRLNKSMTFFKVPAIFIGDTPDLAGLDIVLNRRTDVDPQGRGNMEVYRDLLHNIKAHELASRLLGMPEITINLHSLQYQGFPDRPFLDLAPSAFLDGTGENDAGSRTTTGATP